MECPNCHKLMAHILTWDVAAGRVSLWQCMFDKFIETSWAPDKPKHERKTRQVGRVEG